MKSQRPIIAPEVTVEQVSANAYWNTQYASNGTPVVPYVGASPCSMKPVVPIHGVPGQNMKAKPHSQKVMPQMQVSAIPSTRILTVSRERANPASSITNPTCMQKTRYAATSVHTVLIALICGGGSGGAASAYAALGMYHFVISKSTSPSPIVLPASSDPALRRTTGSRHFSRSCRKTPATAREYIDSSPPNVLIGAASWGYGKARAATMQSNCDAMQ